MSKLFPLILLIAAALHKGAAPLLPAARNAREVNDSTRLLFLARSFEQLNTKIRDGSIDKPAAKAQFGTLLREIRTLYLRRYGAAPARWVFPLQGYGEKAIGGSRGNGYRPGGYQYFDGNRHKGHAAHDLFIRDRNSDSRDDGTGSPVPVLSVSGGIVVAAETTWDTAGTLRGGKYIWIYDPAANGLLYYAHNDAVFVSAGGVVRPGQRIAVVGRTGLNAFKKRSPTHLHFTWLLLDETFTPKPADPYHLLVAASKGAARG